MLQNITNWFLGRYYNHPEAVIISCYFNPEGNPYRLKAFNKFYDSIKHLNHKIIECVIGDGKPELSKEIEKVYTKSLLWHKEALLNKIIKGLPKKYKYVYWIDADVLFTNKKWLIEGVKVMKGGARIIQPFDVAVHLDEHEESLPYSIERVKHLWNINAVEPKAWRSFCATFNYSERLAEDSNYNKHGMVGFAWGAQRSILDTLPLYDHALIGGADHIIAHAAAGHIPHKCIQKSFTDNLTEIESYSKQLHRLIKGKIGYVEGFCLHLWHGNIENREYLKRIQDFTATNKQITEKDKNGLYTTNNEKQQYVKDYYNKREVGRDGKHLTTFTQKTNKKKVYAPYKGGGRMVKIGNDYYSGYSAGIRDGRGNLIDEMLFWQMFYDYNHDITPQYIEINQNDNSYKDANITYPNEPVQFEHHHDNKCDHNNNNVPDYQEVSQENNTETNSGSENFS